ncbi:MAG: hypothetical protein ACRCWR_04945, partial [Saezia sp.]
MDLIGRKRKFLSKVINFKQENLIMRKLNRMVLGIVVAFGLSAAAFVGAQQEPAAQANGANTNGFDCPYYDAAGQQGG